MANLPVLMGQERQGVVGCSAPRSGASEQEIALRQRQFLRGFADEQFAIGDDRVGFRSIWMSGVASLWIMLFLEMPPRTFSTATISFSVPSRLRSPLAIAACETKTSEVEVTALPKAPNIGR